LVPVGSRLAHARTFDKEERVSETGLIPFVTKYANRGDVDFGSLLGGEPI